MSKEAFVDSVLKTTALSEEAAGKIWDRWKDHNPGKIFKAIPAIIAEVGAVGKNKKNEQQGYMFRAADDVSDSLRPLMGKHGIFPVKRIVERNVADRETRGGGLMSWVTIKCVWTFYADDGSSISTESFGEGMDTLDKAHNKAETGSMKNALIQVFQLMGHEDSEGPLPEGSERPGPSRDDRVRGNQQRGNRRGQRPPPRNQPPLPEGREPTAAELAAHHGLQTGDQIPPPPGEQAPPKKTVAEMAKDTIAECVTKKDLELLKKVEGKIRDRHKEHKITEQEFLDLGTLLAEAEDKIKGPIKA